MTNIDNILSNLNVTNDDLLHAASYAWQFVKKHRYVKQNTENRWHLPPYELIIADFNKEFHIPSALITDFKMYKYKFTEDSCKKMSCFFNLHWGGMCPADKSKREVTTLQINNNKIYNVCQDACYANPTSNEFPFTCETYYINYECYMRNVDFKKWCLLPELRNNESWAVPGFDYDETTGVCSINKEYCKRFGMEFDNSKQECFITDGQWFAEQIFGSNFIRTLKYSYSTFGRMQNKNQTLNIDEIIPGLLFDMGVDLSGVVSKHLSLKALPLLNKKIADQLILKFSSKFGIAVARTAAVSLILESSKHIIIASLALKLAAIISMTTTSVSFALLLLSVIGMIFDAVDFMGLKHITPKTQINKLKYAFQYFYSQNFENKDSEGNVQCTPEFFIEMYSQGKLSSIENELYMQHLCTYFKYLEVNSDGLPVKNVINSALTVEALIDRISNTISKKDDETKLQPLLNRLQSVTVICFCFLIPLFLAFSV